MRKLPKNLIPMLKTENKLNQLDFIIPRIQIQINRNDDT